MQKHLISLKEIVVNDNFGYVELEHTADWALKVWAPDLEMLFITAAKGMYDLSEISFAQNETQDVRIQLDAPDDETLLVDFLSELLFYGEIDNVAFHKFNLILEGSSLRALLTGSPILSRKKEIKAVTYHNLEITERDNKLEVIIVFDV